MRIKELYEEERPREKMLARGPEAMTTAELLAILLATGTRKENVLEVANRLLARCGGNLGELAAMSKETMMETDGIGPVKYATIAAALELGRRSFGSRTTGKMTVNGPETVWRMIGPRMKGLEHEELWIVYLNSGNRVLHVGMASKGGSTATVIDPKIIVKEALDRRARGIIMVHNHPSGNPRPGERDIEETENIKKAVNTFDISLLDHIIICDDCYFSFADERVSVMG